MLAKKRTSYLFVFFGRYSYLQGVNLMEFGVENLEGKLVEAYLLILLWDVAKVVQC